MGCGGGDDCGCSGCSGGGRARHEFLEGVGVGAALVGAAWVLFKYVLKP